MAVVSTNLQCANDHATIRQALRWFRKLSTDGMHDYNMNAQEADGMMDLALRFEEMAERTAKTGILQNGDVSSMEEARR